MKYNLHEVERVHVEDLQPFDTEYDEILANSPHPELEISLREWGAEAEEARRQTQWLTVLNQQPQTSQEKEKWIETWEEATGRTLSEEEFLTISQPLWGS